MARALINVPAQAKRGEVIYYERCGACHGPQLEGGDMTPPLVGGTFTSTWNELALSELYERIRITMPLNQPSTLSRQQTADVTAFLLKSNKWPAGQTELPRELEPLKDVVRSDRFWGSMDFAPAESARAGGEP